MTTPQTRKPRQIATPEQFEGLTLMQMTTKNIKRVRYIDITFDDPLTIIGGDNAQGKTSYVNSYGWLFGGRDAIGLDPIYHGEPEGFIEGKFGDGETVKLAVKRTLKRVGAKDYVSDVEIEIPGYIAPSQRETFLKKLVGPLPADPLAFDRMSDDEKLKTLQALVAFDFKANKEEYDAIYKQRRDVNSQLKTAQGAIASIAVSDKPPCERVDEEALVQELQEAGTKNADIATRKANRAQAEQRIETLRKEADELLAGVDANVAREEARTQLLIDDYERQIKELQAKIENARTELTAESDRIRTEAAESAKLKNAEAASLQDRLDNAAALAEPIDVDAIRARLDDARAKNKQLDAWQQLRDRKNEYALKVESLQVESDELTTQLAELAQAKVDAIRKADLPIDGLSFDDGLVTLGGVPWSEASEAERIDASMALAMAMQPKIKAIMIRDGSGVGSKIKQRIRERARAAGYRVLMEILDESGANSTVHIEDGVVKAVAGKSAEAAA